MKISCKYYFVIASKGRYKSIFSEYKNDIIGIDIIDSYFNLTIITSNIYKYYLKYKLKSNFIIKIDDDIYPNIPLINMYINLYVNKMMISGFYYSPMKVSRNRNSSVYLPFCIYSGKIFPSFVAGGFVITPSKLISMIYLQLSKEKRIIYREDMHMAIIYKQLNISFQKLNKIYHRKNRIIKNKNKVNDICYHGF